MNLLNKSVTLLFAIVVLMTACSKENLDETIVGEPNFEPDTIAVNTLINALQANLDVGLDLGCITIQYPFDLLLESGMTLTINSTSEFEAVADQGAADQVVDFVFPLTVSTENGESMEANSNEELGVLFGSCVPDDGWDETTSNDGTFTIPAFLFEELCFDLVYPVDVEDTAGNIYTANEEGELIDLLATTATNLSFILPISVLDEAGNETLIESVSGFYDLYYSCDGVSHPGTEGGIVLDLSDLDSTNCNFETLAVQYPYNILTESGELVSIEDENQEAALILSGENYTLQYPFNLVDAEGQVIVVTSELEFILLILPCLITVEEPESCHADAHVLLFFNGLNIFTINKYEYEINFPVTLIVEGTEVVVNNGDEYLPAVGGSPFDLLETEIVYPVTVTQFGQEIVLNSDADVCQFYETLDEPCVNKPAHIQFFFNEGGGTPINCAYFISYPLNIEVDGETIQVSTREDYLDKLNESPTAYDEIELVYPVSINQVNSGQQLFFESDEDICEYLDNCE